jgi:ArpU family phage transcriptional regulator
MVQLSFQLPEIDREETEKLVEMALEKYRIYLLTFQRKNCKRCKRHIHLFLLRTPMLFIHLQTAVIRKMDFECERNMEWIRRGMNRLSPRERKLIIKRYLRDEKMYDYEAL